MGKVANVAMIALGIGAVAGGVALAYEGVSETFEDLKKPSNTVGLAGGAADLGMVAGGAVIVLGGLALTGMFSLVAPVVDAEERNARELQKAREHQQDLEKVRAWKAMNSQHERARNVSAAAHSSNARQRVGARL